MPAVYSQGWPTEAGEDGFVLGLNGTLLRRARDTAGLDLAAAQGPVAVQGPGAGVRPSSGQIAISIAFDVNNTVILMSLVIALVIYIVLGTVLLIKRWWGGKRPLYVMKWPPKSIKRANPYLVTIVTGSRKDSGTEGTVVFSIHGRDSSTENYSVTGGVVHFDSKMFSCCGQDNFLITSDEPLGAVTHATVSLWVTDSYDNWYLSYITVLDIKKKVSWYLPLHKWITGADGGREVIAEAKIDKTQYTFLDNLLFAIRERNIWLCPWLSTVLGSKSDSMFSITLCYLAITSYMLASAGFFYTSAYSSQNFFSAAAFVYVFFVTAAVTSLATLLQSCIRAIHVGAGDFLSRYSPVLLRDMSAAPHVHWDVDSNGPDTFRSDEEDLQKSLAYDEEGLRSEGTAGHKRLSESPKDFEERVPSSLGYSAQRNSQQNNSNDSSDLGNAASGRERRNRAMASDDVLRQESQGPVQRNNNNRSGLGSRSSRSIFPTFSSSIVDGPRRSLGADRTQPSVTAAALQENFAACQDHTTVNNSTALFGGFGWKNRRYESNLESGYGEMLYTSPLTTPCPKHSYTGYESHPYLQTKSSHMSINYGTPLTYRPEYETLSSRNLAKMSLSECNRSVTALPRSDDWRPSTTGRESRFSSSRSGYARGKGYAYNDSKIFRNRSFYNDSLWRSDDSTSKDDFIERSFSNGIASTKKFSYLKDCDYGSSGHLYSWKQSKDPYFGRNPLASKSLLKDENDIAPCDFSSTDGDRKRAEEVERSWNALWNHVKPYVSKVQDADVPKFTADVNNQTALDLRGFAGKLVENIICKIKKQLVCPDQKDVDLTDCEFDIETCMRRLGQHFQEDKSGGESCGRYKKDGNDPCGDLTSDDALLQRIARSVTDGAIKSSLAMLDKRVAAIVSDVEQVREHIIDRMRQELGLEQEQQQSCELLHQGQKPSQGNDECRSNNATYDGQTASDFSTLRTTDDFHSRRTSTSGDRSMPSSARQSTVLDKKEKSTLAHVVQPLTEENIAPNLTDTKLTQVARSSLKAVLNQKGMESIRDTTKAAAEGDLKGFATDIVNSLYMAVRTKLQQMLQHEYESEDDATVPFPAEELLKKADHEVKEQVLPTVVEHIVWLMKEEAKVMGQLDCDMMMIAFAGQYVDTIVTNAVLKTHVDLAKKRAYSRTFVVTSNSNNYSDATCNSNNNTTDSGMNNNSNNNPDATCDSSNNTTDSGMNNNSNNNTGATFNSSNNTTDSGMNNNSNNNTDAGRSNNINRSLASMLDRCLEEKRLTIENLGRLSATRVQVDDLFQRSAIETEEDLVHNEILFGVFETFLGAIRVRSQLENSGGSSRNEICACCQGETIRSVVMRCLTPLSAKLITDLVLDEAEENLEECGWIVERNLSSCSPGTMVALGRALLDGTTRASDHWTILESVTAELKGMAMEKATSKVVGDLMVIGDGSRVDVEKEVRRRIDRLLTDARTKTEKMMLKTALRANFQQNNADQQQVDANVNHNAMAADKRPSGRRRLLTAADVSADFDDQLLDQGEADGGETDAENIVDEMIGIRNSLTRIADEDQCLTGHCRLHKGRLSRNLPSGHCESVHCDESKSNNESQGHDNTPLTHSLADLDGGSLSDLWHDPKDTHRLTFLFLGHLALGLLFSLLVSFTVGCLVMGLTLNSLQAVFWLQMTVAGVMSHVFFLEPIKILLLTMYWTLLRNELMR